jgi:hypothetical protein
MPSPRRHPLRELFFRQTEDFSNLRYLPHIITFIHSLNNEKSLPLMTGKALFIIFFSPVFLVIFSCDSRIIAKKEKAAILPKYEFSISQD